MKPLYAFTGFAVLALIVAFATAPAQAQSGRGLLDTTHAAQFAKHFAVWGTIKSVENGLRGQQVITARENLTGTISTTKRTVSRFAPKFRIGETVYKNRQGDMSAAQFPIKKSKEERIKGGHMHSDVTLSDNGRIDGVTRTWTSDELNGFEGGVVVAVTDLSLNILWVTPLHKWGINGHSVPGASSDVTRSWSETVPADVMNKAAFIAIIQMDSPTDKIKKFLGDVKADAALILPLVIAIIEIYSLAEGSGGTTTTTTTGSGG